MKDFLVDLALPRTDGEVFAQWIVMSVFWVLALVISRGWSRDVRLFIYGLVMMNLAWFALRTVH